MAENVERPECKRLRPEYRSQAEWNRRKKL